jgi:ubiquinone/menaquinone biosynthesis C-methylase UbiE
MSVASWQSRFYPDPAKLDLHQHFLAALERHINPASVVLDVGAGAGELNSYDLKGRVRRIVGVDLDPRVTSNPLLDEGIQAEAGELPFADNSFDVAFSIYVLEHISDPRGFVGEIQRVLKPGGVFIALTPNRWHYVPVIAAVTPLSFHRWVNERRGRAADDTFPTFYRMNTRRAQTRLFESAGFETAELTMLESPPNYLKFSTPTFLAGVAYERLVNATSWLTDLRVNIISAFRKLPAAQPDAAPRMTANAA